ncbi:hypothetical protein ACRS6K_21745 [Bacillus cytotoxicus]
MECLTIEAFFASAGRYEMIEILVAGAGFNMKQVLSSFERI